MDRFTYYEGLKELARTKRAEYNVSTATFGLREVGKIYRAEKVRIDYRDLTPRIRALYMCDDGDCSVAIRRTLPPEPRLFSLVHELKHHYKDREQLDAGKIAIVCSD